MKTQPVDNDLNIPTGLARFFKKWRFTRCGNDENPFGGYCYCAIIKGVAFWCPFFDNGDFFGIWVIGKECKTLDLNLKSMTAFIHRNIGA